MPGQPAQARKVMVLAYDDANILDVVGPIAFLTSAGRPSGGAGYEVELIAVRPGPFHTFPIRGVVQASTYLCRQRHVHQLFQTLAGRKAQPQVARAPPNH